MDRAKAQILERISLIEDAMRAIGIWSTVEPTWIGCYQGGKIPDFWEWLQFVHLPQRASGQIQKAQYLAPQARKYLDPSVTTHGLLIQRIIELDAMTSTINHA
jgi:uncharacterized protein YqcC (DUF446 family)